MAGHFSNYQYFFEFIILSLYRIGGWNDDCFIDFDIAPTIILPEILANRTIIVGLHVVCV